MPHTLTAQERAALRARNLLVQEVVETRQRARLGGWFYGIAAALAFAVTGFGAGHRLSALIVIGGLLLLATARALVPVSATPDEHEGHRYLRRIWTVVLVTTTAWGAFSAWSQVALPHPAPLITLLFSGAFGMAIAHTLCMRRLPSALAIATVMLPTQVMLRREVALGVGVMWIVYTVYMLLVMIRSHREYRARLSLEEDLRQQRDLFARQSRIDGLTGLANRREFSETLDRDIARAGAGRALSLLILDIDHFKRINDTYGHACGDACLVEFARRLRADFGGEGELCARLGGEEFGVLLWSGPDAAHVRAGQFRAALATVPFAFDAETITVTVSIGCGGYDARCHADADALYRSVDAAMYRAKVAGRDRVERADAPATDASDALPFANA